MASARMERAELPVQRKRTLRCMVLPLLEIVEISTRCRTDIPHVQQGSPAHPGGQSHCTAGSVVSFCLAGDPSSEDSLESARGFVPGSSAAGSCFSFMRYSQKLSSRLFSCGTKD